MPQKFEGLSRVLKTFQNQKFQKLNEKNKQHRVSAALFDLIEKVQPPCFLLPAVLAYIEEINAHKILESYAFFHFELWLNQFSHLSEEENSRIRGKIAGKWVPRDCFQLLFPIGMDKVYSGSHVVTAHSSPDLDTTVASFWGWVDAFTARVSDGLHLWNVPGGAPASQVELGLLFYEIFGKEVFHTLAKTRTTLSLSSIDLMTQKGFECRHLDESTLEIDHQREQKAIVLVDKEGYFLGDWRHFDVEGVRQVIAMLESCLRWLENQIHVKLVSLFAQEKLSLKEIPSFIQGIFSAKFSTCQPVQGFTLKQKAYLQSYLSKVLGVDKGLECTIEEFASAMKAHSLCDFEEFIALVKTIDSSSLFDRSGKLIENRPKIFNYIEKLIETLDHAIQSVQKYVERLEISLSIKTHVFEHVPHCVSYRADVDEIKSKMGGYPYLSVTLAEKEGKSIPLGIVHAHDLHKPILGTVTVRDFCNREETKIPSYLEVISVIDHHKSNLQTTSAPVATIADTQSSNVLCAEFAFSINDRFGTAGMSAKQIEAQVSLLSQRLASAQNKRLMRRLIQRQLAEEERNGFFIDPTREALEYLHFLHGILDDTDLLTKVSRRDVECVAQLVNRLKSLMLQEEVEVISFKDLPQDRDFVDKAAARILQNADMYSLYRKVYLAKEDAVEVSISHTVKGQDLSFYADTKEQNGCARVGQAKLFSRNYPSFSKHVSVLRQRWYDTILEKVAARQEIDLHLQMISTIAGAEDLYAGKEGEYKHKDELWIWIPFTEQSIEHLKGFLSAFLTAPHMQKDGLSVEFYGDKAKEYEQIFAESYSPLSKKTITEKGSLPIAVLKYTAGLINSRKAMVSPYLPKI